MARSAYTLDADTEKLLWKDFKKNGDEAARESLIVGYLGFVKVVSGRMAMKLPSNLQEDDLYGWGVLGLIDATERFDPERGIAFKTYAITRIKGAIYDKIRSLDWAPRSLRQMARQIENAENSLRGSLGRVPTEDEIAGEIGEDSDKVRKVKQYVKEASLLSLDFRTETDGDTQVSLLDMAPDEGIPSPDAALLEQERAENLASEIAALPEQQKKVIYLYYFEELTLKEIGAILEVTESRVSQVHSQAMKSLRKHMG